MKRFRVGDAVWKSGSAYSGPGMVVAEFKGWMGNVHYVVEHQIGRGKGFFYHIYTGQQLEHDTPEEPGKQLHRDGQP